ncbi:MAG TPA: GldG family protein, partial [Phycisphaerales bacterium]|nr:GldG family protein [Phycisphaerales bacterium]
MNKALTSLVALAAVLIAFIALNIVASATLRGARVDMTSGRLYTLSQGTRNIARSLEEPVRLTLYFSEKPADDLPQFKNHARRVKEMLREYAAVSGGKIRFEVVDPEPFSKAEDDASAAGLVGAPTGRGADTLYFGLVGSGAADDRQVIPFFDPGKEEFLEYDISRLVYLLSSPRKKKVGLMSWLPLDGGPPNPMMRQMPQPWQIHAQIAEYFDLQPVATDAARIPADIAVLMVVHPKRISERTQYAIDQFVLGGGRALIFVDPLCDADVPPGVNPMQAMGLPRDSDLPRLLPAWGLELVPESLAADNRTAVRVNAGSQNSPRSVAYPIWMNVGSATENFDASDPVTGTLRSMLIPTAGVLRPRTVEGLTVQPLIRTTGESMLVPVSSVSFMPDPEKILREFAASGERMILAARVTGKARSAFPDGPP